MRCGCGVRQVRARDMEVTLRESDLSLEQVRRLVRAADVRGDEAAASELKAWAERTAAAIRADIGLTGTSPLKPERLAAHLGVELLRPDEIDDLPPDICVQLLETDPKIKVDIIVTAGIEAALGAKQATSSIPIVGVKRSTPETQTETLPPPDFC